MPTVETTITLSIPEGGMSLEAWEAVVAEEVRRAAQVLLVGGQAVEAEVLGRGSQRLHRDKLRSLDLLTRFGWVKLRRWYVQERATGRYVPSG